jgi:hypothetical protein
MQGHSSFGQMNYESAILSLETRSWMKISQPSIPAGTKTEYVAKRLVGRAGWTGTEAVFFVDGRILKYNPFLDRWTMDVETAYPDAILANDFKWTGTEFIFWDSTTNTGYKYYP